MHLEQDDGRVYEVVMEDSPRELRRHLPIWMHAHGRVLVTGLGLGCVVRGLLASPHVEYIDVAKSTPTSCASWGRNSPAAAASRSITATRSPSSSRTAVDGIAHGTTSGRTATGICNRYTPN
jgi:hypothetical protein